MIALHRPCQLVGLHEFAGGESLLPHDAIAALNSINPRPGGFAAKLDEDVVNWVPRGHEVPEPRGLFGFARGDTPKIVGEWIAWAKAWATPEDVSNTTSIASLASMYRKMLSSHRYTDLVNDMWDTLMQLFRDGSGLLPVPWAWYRLRENPRQNIYGIFSPAVLQVPWRRAKFWEEIPKGTFAPRVRLWASATHELQRQQRLALGTGRFNREDWDRAMAEQYEQNGKIYMAINKAHEVSNLALWLAEGESLLKALRIKKYAVTSL